MPEPTATPADDRGRVLDDPATFFTHPQLTRKERLAAGRERRRAVPLASHAVTPSPDVRPNPVAILRQQEAVREPALVPLRYARMSADPFAFLRGAAAVMASDLSLLPTSGIAVQLCGDAHLVNFGMFASTERALVFDINDFDETLPGPFDWDVKRLAASIAVAGQATGLKDRDARRAAKAAVTWYRSIMADVSRMRTLDVWNARIDVDALVNRMGKSSLRKATVKASDKSRRSTSASALLKLTTTIDGKRRFRDEPPVLSRVPAEQFDDVVARFAPAYEKYLRSLPAERLALLAKFTFVDLAHKVVGVGSVGTRALVLLMESGDGEPLLLQVKQANSSVLEPYLGASRFDNAGKRVVIGQRVLQASGDPFLGWTHGGKRTPYDFYVRQLKDQKSSIEVPLLDRDGLIAYAQLCGATLARAHARAGDAAAITGYLGDTEEFDDAIAEFALAYTRLNSSDHATLVADLAEPR